MVKLGGGGSFINRAYPVTFYTNEIGGTVCLDLNILKTMSEHAFFEMV